MRKKNETKSESNADGNEKKEWFTLLLYSYIKVEFNDVVLGYEEATPLYFAAVKPRGSGIVESGRAIVNLAATSMNVMKALRHLSRRHYLQVTTSAGSGIDKSPPLKTLKLENDNECGIFRHAAGSRFYLLTKGIIRSTLMIVS